MRWRAAAALLVAGLAPPRAGGAEAFRIAAAAGDIAIDGTLDEPAWAAATEIGLPIEVAPGENTPAPVATVCRLTYDRRILYLGCRAEDPEPGAIRARLTDRDQALDDDLVGIRLDPFHDGRRAFEFYVNPLGVQIDQFRDDLGNDRMGDNEDTSWDAIWDSAGRITATGYEVELAIPFSSLRFPETDGQRAWGFGLLRLRPRRDRVELSSEPRDRNRDCQVCQLSTLTGLEGMTPGLHLELDPTVTAERADRREPPGSGEMESGEVEVEPGITLTWGPLPDVILSGALNPDFSQVEADALELDVNRQFAIQYPERRPFFLEGADLFATPLTTVFTRNVADPDWGTKVTGKRGGNAFGAFVAEDARTTILLPAAERSTLAELGEDSLDAAVRYRRDIRGGGALGLVATAREAGAYRSGVAGFDGLLRFTSVDSLRFQLLGSSTRYPSRFAAEHGQPQGGFDDRALYLFLIHDSRDWRLQAQYEDIGEDFRADLGFLPQVDRRYGKALAERTWWGGPDDRWIRLSAGVDTSRTDDQRGGPLERLDEVWVIFEGRRELVVFTQAADRERTLGGRRFRNRYVEGRAGVRVHPVVELGVEWNVGDDVDLAGLRPADQATIAPSLTWTPGRHLRATLEHQRQELDVEAGRLFTAGLTELRLVWQFTRRSFARAIVQYRDLERDPELYAEPVEARTERLFGQLLFSYRLNPQTVAYLGYSDVQLGTGQIDLQRAERTFFVKLGYAWLP
jgi:hypothetical protein